MVLYGFPYIQISTNPINPDKFSIVKSRLIFTLRVLSGKISINPLTWDP